ncbi:MAG: alpha/beta fold hydrolase [Caulobacterales bacterium]
MNWTEQEIEAAALAIAGTYGGTPPARYTKLAAELEGAQRHDVQTPPGTLAAWRVGDGPAVLLVHGFSDSHALWGPLMAALKQNCRAFVAFDLPGHGLSCEGTSTTDMGMDAIYAVANALGPIDAIVAHSMSAASAICALAEDLRVERAVMIAAATPNERQFVELQRRAPEGAPAAVIARAREILLSRQEPFADRIYVSHAAARLQMPALLVHSRDDDRWSPEGSAHIASLWQGAQLHLVDGLGHRKIARDADVVLRVAAFLDE